MDDCASSFEVLLSTIKYGNDDDLAELLELDGLNPVDTRNNCIAIIYAIIDRDINKIKLLLSYDCAIDGSGTNLFYTPLHYAVGTNDKEIVRLLLESGASIITNSETTVKTPLYKAMKEAKFELVDLMLSIYYDLQKIDPSNKQEFIHFNIACIRNNKKLVEDFIRKGINVNGILDNCVEEWAGYTPLFMSVKYLSVEVVEILLKHKADFTFQDKSGCSPLHLAYYVWRNNHHKTDEIDKASDIIDLILTAHTKNINNPVNMEGLSHFHIACMGRNTTLVYNFLQSGVNVNSPIIMNSQFSSARVPLHLAIEHNRIDIVRALLENKANINAKNADGLTSLKMAYEKKLYKIAELLLDFNATIPTEDYKGYNSIFQAFSDFPASGKIIDIMFVACQKNIVNSTNEDGLSLLQIACTRKNIKIIEKLLLSTSDVNACIHEKTSKWAGYTALHFAAYTQNLDAINLLLKFKADVNVVEERGFTPLWLSLKAQPKYIKIENIINDKFHQYDLEHENIDKEQIIDSVSCELKHTDVVELLARNKSNLNHKNYIGESLLIGAYNSFIRRFTNKRRNSEIIISKICYSYFLNSARQIMTSLIKHGIDLNVRDEQENHVLHYIVRSIKNNQCIALAMEIAEIILRNGVNVNVPDQNGNTPLHIATQYGCLTFVQFLMRFNADIDATNKTLHTPLHIATMLCSSDRVDGSFSSLITVFRMSHVRYINFADNRNSLTILQCLLQSNCNINAQALNGETPLFIAARSKDIDCVTLILEYGGDINVKGLSHKTLLENISLEYELADFDDNSCFEILEALIWHTLKLIMIGHFVDPSNLLRCVRFENRFKFYYRKTYICEEEDCDSAVPKKYTAILREELEKLKDVKVDQYTSLYDILLKNVQQMTKHAKNENLAKHIYSKTLYTEFPNYGYLLKLKFREGLARNLILDKATESFEYCTENMLPYSIVHNVFTYITNDDMNNLVLARS